MSVTDGFVMPSSKVQGMKELLHPALLAGVTAHPAKAGTRGQEQTFQFVSHASSYSGMFIENDGGTCVFLLAVMGNGCTSGKKAVQMDPDSNFFELL